jgi:mRNA interferase HigB
VIAWRKIREFIESHPGAQQHEGTFRRWCKIVEMADWREWADIEGSFASADRVGEFVVFNVGGNKYRVVAYVDLAEHRPAVVYLKFVGTHKEYDKLDL